MLPIKGFTLPTYFDENFCNKILEMEVYDDDVWITSYPKSGTTWTQEMVWLICNDVDFNSAKNAILDERSPFLEVTSFRDYKKMESDYGITFSKIFTDSVGYVQKLKSPRIIKTHLPFCLLPKAIQSGHKRPKIIHVIRNPKDICVSWYHHKQIFSAQNMYFDEQVCNFMKSKEIFSPYWKNVHSYWKQRNQNNVLFLNYRDMKTDIKNVIHKVASFLEKPLGEVSLNALCEHLSFNNMKQNAAVNKQEEVDLYKKIGICKENANFIRAGKIDQYKSFMTKEVEEMFDDWIMENIRDMNILF